ncbi:hypothetical protein KIPB_010538, partial [Kipferlia bialata]|eukprot:g10538.t1
MPDQASVGLTLGMDTDAQAPDLLTLAMEGCDDEESMESVEQEEIPEGYELYNENDEDIQIMFTHHTVSSLDQNEKEGNVSAGTRLGRLQYITEELVKNASLLINVAQSHCILRGELYSQ